MIVVWGVVRYDVVFPHHHITKASTDLLQTKQAELTQTRGYDCILVCTVGENAQCGEVKHWWGHWQMSRDTSRFALIHHSVGKRDPLIWGQNSPADSLSLCHLQCHNWSQSYHKPIILIVYWTPGGRLSTDSCVGWHRGLLPAQSLSLGPKAGDQPQGMAAYNLKTPWNIHSFAVLQFQRVQGKIYGHLTIYFELDLYILQGNVSGSYSMRNSQ